MFFWDEDSKRVKDILEHVIGIRNKCNHKSLDCTPFTGVAISNDLNEIMKMISDLSNKVDLIEKKLKPVKLKKKK